MFIQELLRYLEVVFRTIHKKDYVLDFKIFVEEAKYYFETNFVANSLRLVYSEIVKDFSKIQSYIFIFIDYKKSQE